MQGKVVIITGAGGGIGSAAARLFMNAGAVVYGWDIQFAADFPEGAHAMQLDIRQLKDVTSAASQVQQAEGRIDVLINNAGITRDARLDKMSPEQ